jgi:hypothetical protein
MSAPTAQGAPSASTQYVALFALAAARNGGLRRRFSDAHGDAIFTFVATRACRPVSVSSQSIAPGQPYTSDTGDRGADATAGGLHPDGAPCGRSEVASITAAAAESGWSGGPGGSGGSQ